MDFTKCRIPSWIANNLLITLLTVFSLIIGIAHHFGLTPDWNYVVNTLIGIVFGSAITFLAKRHDDKKQERNVTLKNLLKTEYALLIQLQIILQLYDFIIKEREGILNGTLITKLSYPKNIPQEIKLAIELNPFEDIGQQISINLNELTFLLEKSNQLVNSIFCAVTSYHNVLRISQMRNKSLYQIANTIKTDILDLGGRIPYSRIETDTGLAAIGYLKSHTQQLFKITKNYIEDTCNAIYKLDAFLTKEFDLKETLIIEIDEEYRYYLTNEFQDWKKVNYYEKNKE